MSLSDAKLRAARARVSSVVVPPLVDAELGEVTLRDDQRYSAARVAAALARYGGCLLADDVGQGKTFVALAIARSWRRPLAIVPTSLRDTWRAAMRRAGVECALASHESLSRSRPPSLHTDGIIVDESHRFRSPDARRYAALARLAAHTRLLLLSATPLQNATRDLAAQLALFVGARAFTLPAEELARFVVRGATRSSAVLPAVAPPQWVCPAADDGEVLRALLALPPPPLPLDGGDAGALRTIALVRAWASSRAALASMLRRRRQAAAAMEQCAMEGLRPSRRELRAWQGADVAVQLGFAPLLVATSLGDLEGDALLRAIAAEREGLGRLQHAMLACTDPDDARIATLRSLRRRHAPARVLAFSEHAATVRAYWAALRSDAGVGMLTASDARIVSGRLSRAELLARFAPRAQGTPEPPPRERVELLLATDLLSEGVNLQDASVVVHLDLPWNPARLAQRVGRLRRPGGALEVHSYLMAPPAESELLLDVEARLRRKLACAERTIGRAIDVVPVLGPPSVRGNDRQDESGCASASALGALAERVARWKRRGAPRRVGTPRTIVAAVCSARRGWLAALDDGRLVASLDGAAADAAHAPVEASALVEGAARPVDDVEATAARDALERWLAAEQLALDCGVASVTPPLYVALERRIARALSDSPRHERAATVALAHRLRDALRAPHSLGAERELSATLSRADYESGAAWLRHALAITSSGARGVPLEESRARLVALILLGPP